MILQARILEWAVIPSSRGIFLTWGLKLDLMHCRQILYPVKFTRSVVFKSLRPHGLQHARLPCSSPTLGACSNSCASSRWCHPTISSSVVPFSSCLQSFPASGSFPMSQFFTSDGQSIGVSALTSVLPMNIQDWFPLGWTGWISLQSKGLSRIFSPTPQIKSINSALRFLYSPTLTSIHDHRKNATCPCPVYLLLTFCIPMLICYNRWTNINP